MQAIHLALNAEPPIEQHILSDLSRCSLKQYFQFHHESGSESDNQALWHCLISSALTQNATEKYLTAACNCISVFLLNSVSSPCERVKTFAFTSKVWFEAYECAQRAFDNSKTKPALQVLETLTQLLKESPDKASASSILRQSSKRMIEVLITGQPPRQVKPACIALTCFIKKTDLLCHLEGMLDESLGEVSRSQRRYQPQANLASREDACDASSSQHLFLALLCAIENLETRSSSLKLFSHLLHAETWTRNNDPESVAVAAIELFLTDRMDSLQDFVDNILPVIIDNESRFQAFRNTYKPGTSTSESKLSLYLSVLQTGKKRGYISEDDVPKILSEALEQTSSREPKSGDTYISFRKLLRSGSPSLRVHAYNLLVTTFGTVTAISEGALNCVISCLAYLHDDNDAHERGEIISVHRRLLKRIENSRANVQRRHANQQSMVEAKTLRYYQIFLVQLGTILLGELNPGISYQRHILALGTLQQLVNAAGTEIMDIPATTAALSGLVLDQFDDVRSLSTGILAKFGRRGLANGGFQTLWALTQRTAALSARTCRHDHADACGKLWSIIISTTMNVDFDPQTSLHDLVSRLEAHLSSSPAILPEMAFPLHAILLGSSYGLDRKSGNKIQNLRLINICKAIWEQVQPRLCVDAPETETEDEEEESSRGPKDLLAYSWRALRDSSLLLQAVLRHCHEDFTATSLVGWLCVEQLTLLRHRGAFSTVAQTFNLCCENARNAADVSIRELNRDWYQAALEQIDEQATKLTRRSAGLPAMVCAVLSASDPTFFAMVYADLHAKASLSVTMKNADGLNVRLPQVHALNCLKDIFLSSKLRSIAQGYIGEVLQLAAKSLSSPIWAIRNCGLMLLRASMNRLDTESSQPSAHLDGSNRTTQLPSDIAIDLLSSADDPAKDPDSHSEIVFAGLDLAKHIRSVDLDRQRLNILIHRQLSSPVWAIRDHAAHVLSGGLLQITKSYEVLNAFLPPSHVSNNLKHGTLLLLRYLIRELSQRMGTPEVLQHFIGSLEAHIPLVSRRSSPYVMSAMLDVINDMLLYMLSQDPSLTMFTEARDSLLELAKQIEPSSAQIYWSRELRRQFLHELLRIIHRCDETGHTSSMLMPQLVEDPDVARSVVESFQNLTFTSSPALVHVLTDVVCATTTSDVQAASMWLLAKCLEDINSGLPDEQVTRISACCRTSEPYNKELWNATLRLEACLLVSNLSMTTGSMSKDLISRSKSWVADASFAAKDQLDFSTRMNVAMALKHCGPQLVPQLSRIHTGEATWVLIDLMVLLYDLLNDDDQEVREVAQHAAVAVTSAHSGLLACWIRPCALAARESILESLVQTFRTSSRLAHIAFQRVIGENNAEHSKICSSTTWKIVRSVDENLKQIRASMNDLFAEEKQNLYVDEVAELEKWAGVLDQCGIELLSSQWDAVMKWCSAGLSTLMSLIMATNQAEGGTGDEYHPLHPTYDADVLLVFIRTVRLSRLLIQSSKRDEGSEGDMPGWAGNTVKKLRELHSLCLDTRVHPKVLESLSNSISD